MLPTHIHEISVPVLAHSTTAIVYPAQGPSTRPGSSRAQSRDDQAARPATLILAHGAGAGQQHPFLVSFARALSGGAARGEGAQQGEPLERGGRALATNLDVVTFNFLYTEQGRRIPDRMPQLVACYEAVIAAAREHLPSARERLFIGGKSMGGRAATHVAAETPVVSGFPGPSAVEGSRTVTVPISGIVLLGYPLHPPGRPDQLRDAHLPDVKCPMLFVQGTRDTFGTPSELRPIIERLSPLATLHAVDGGDHSFKIGGRDAGKQAAIHGEIQDTIIEWIARN